MKATAKAVPGTQGVMPASAAPSQAAHPMPLPQLRHLKLLLMAGATGSLGATLCRKVLGDHAHDHDEEHA